VLTGSTAALGRLRFAPALPLAKSEALASLPLGRVNKVALRFDRLESGWASARSTALSVRFGRYGRPIAEIFLDAAVSRALEPEGEAVQTAFVLDELAAMYGAGIRARVRGARGSDWGRAPWIWGGYAAMRPGGGEARAELMRPVADRLFFAGEAAHPHFFTTVHGAWESGVRAAGEALASRHRA
jgi:monoamine oxidase